MRVIFTQNQAARSLWEFGEDKLALQIQSASDADMKKIHRLVEKYWTEEVSRIVGKKGRTLDLGTVTAVTVVAFIEGRVRPLARLKRRPASQLPHKYSYIIENEWKKQDKFRFPA